MNILKVLNEIAADSSHTGKRSIISLNKFNELFVRVLKLAYDPNYVYYIKEFENRSYLEDHSLVEFEGSFELCMDHLEAMALRKTTGNNAKRELEALVEMLNKDDAEVIQRIIDHDLKAGFGANTINDVIPNLIPETPYMGATSFSEKKARKLFLKGMKCYADTKMDGRYVNVIVHPDGLVEMVSRQGKRSKIDSPTLIQDAKNFGLVFDDSYLGGGKGIVLNGEMVIPGIPRYESNGIIASLVKIAEKEALGEDMATRKVRFLKDEGMSYDDVSKSIDIVIWDYVPLDIYQADGVFQNVRENRYKTLYDMVGSICPNKIRLVETMVVNTYEEAVVVFQAAINRGEEGIILKAFNSFWKSGKGVQQIKMKLEFKCSLEVIGFNEGNKGTKYEGSLGSFKVKSSDGLLFTDPAGIVDKERDIIWNNQSEYLGKIIEVKCNGLSHDSTGAWSLMHPVYDHVRTDKDVADTLDEIKNIQTMIVGLS